MTSIARGAVAALCLVAALGVVTGCSRGGAAETTAEEAAATQPGAAPEAAALPSAIEAAEGVLQTALAGESAGAHPRPRASEPSVKSADSESDDPDGEEDEDSSDYWKDVEFGPTQYDEVLEFVKEHYIDPQVNHKSAFAESCDYTFRSLESGWTAIPKSFHEMRKGHPDEEGELDGEARPLKGYKDIVLVKLPSKEQREARDKAERDKRGGKRMSDDEIRELRAKLQARRQLLDKSWRRMVADRDLVQTCVREARKLGMADEADKRKDLEKWLWLGAAQGYLRALDPHSAIVSEKAWEESTKKTQDSSFDGIGAILTKRDEYIVVESPIEGQPALAAGVRAGDRIIKVDERSVIGWELHKVVKRIRGERGTTVTLQVRREGEPEDLSIPIKRAYIKIQNVESKFVKEHKDIGYIKLTGFVPQSADKIRAAISELESQTATGKLRGLVLDLRRNSGGLLQQAVEIADIFLEDGVIVTVKDRVNAKGGEKIYRATPASRGSSLLSRSSGTKYTEVPLVVLVNDASASASEIVAGAVQDNHRGLVVGDRTFGKASVQTLFNPRKGKDYYIKLTVARYYAPSGRTIQVIGISPDFPVPNEVDGDMPLGFREENLSNHLGAIDTSYVVDNLELREQVKACAGKRGIAEKVHQADPNPQVRFDFPLMKAADYLECMADLTAQARGPKPDQRNENR